MKLSQKPSIFFRCSSCGAIFPKEESSLIQNPVVKCCENASEEYFTPWPSLPVRKLMTLIYEQDLASLGGQQTAVFCLYTVFETLLEETVNRLLKNCSPKDKDQKLAFCGNMGRSMLLNFFDELFDVPLQKYLKANGYPFLMDEYKSFTALRDKVVHNNIKEHTLDEIALISSLAKESFGVFALLNNEITNKSKKRKNMNPINKALIVDDDVETTELVGNFLRKQGLEVIIANSGQEAIDGYKKNNPDIVFLDIALPDIDGIGVLAEIRKYDENASIYFITGIGGEVLREQVKELGAKGHLTKPIFMSDMISIIKGETRF
jgi:CheY-like chemotaxis protein